MFKSLSQFYNSSEWKKLRESLIHKRVNENDGILYCEYSGKPLINSYDIVAHHVIPLTMENVNDFAISLNPENIMLVSQRAHNEIHARFGYCTQRKVYIVYGAPCSGKTSFVNASKGNSDIVIDSDDIWECITGGVRYYKPNALKQNFFEVRRCMLDMVKRRFPSSGGWEKAWIIETLPFKTPREEKAKTLDAELIHIDTNKEECLKRLYKDETRKNVRDEWRKYIEEYFTAYQE